MMDPPPTINGGGKGTNGDGGLQRNRDRGRSRGYRDNERKVNGTAIMTVKGPGTATAKVEEGSIC